MPLYSIGHSNHSVERFFQLLAGFCVSVIVDVRSVPYSRHVPHFNRENLLKLAGEKGISYEWRGDSLGGRHSSDGVRWSGSFKNAIERLARDFGDDAGMKIAVLVCAEGNPRKCHRATLIGPSLRALVDHPVDLQHILPDGTLISQSMLEENGEVPRQDRSGTMNLFDK
jgi:uncharacterized protein (DUF488 family)